jgi:predicted type IV restriction endonuclease
MTAPDAVLELIERFQRNREQYLNPVYNETQVRREFIDPLFVALGWDVDNTCGYAQAYKDVVHEDAIKVGLDARAPDYSFRIGGVRKFFVEAKKPAVNLKDDSAPAYQLRRYAWSAKLPLSLLTDFQEFAVYDCRVRPASTDKASVARILYVPCEQYEERWDEIAGVFSKEAILQGSFDRYAESTKAKKGTAEVDASFLKEIESWRDSLARNIALRNPSLTQRELNYAVQATIDRIIFLRICEDRGIEPYGRLRGLVNGQNVYARLREIYFEADHRYNSGLFHFETEKGRADAPDRLTPNLAIDDKALKDSQRARPANRRPVGLRCEPRKTLRTSRTRLTALAMTSTAFSACESILAGSPGSSRPSYTAIEATSSGVAISGNSQNGRRCRVCATHAWPAMITRAAANTGRRDSGSVLHFHCGSAAMHRLLDELTATLRRVTARRMVRELDCMGARGPALLCICRSAAGVRLCARAGALLESWRAVDHGAARKSAKLPHPSCEPREGCSLATADEPQPGALGSATDDPTCMNARRLP